MAVVDQDKPQGTILWVNRAAFQFRVRPGLRYAAGLSLCSELCAGVVGATDIEHAVEEIARELRRFSPEVEPSGGGASAVDLEHGVFWLNVSGFRKLWPTLEKWTCDVAVMLSDRGLHAAVVTGFDRFCTYALARELAWSGGRGSGGRGSGGRGSRGRESSLPGSGMTAVFDDPEAERLRAARVPLSVLQLEPKMRAALNRLGIATVGDLRKLPAGGLLERFGKSGFLLQRLADGALYAPLQPIDEVAPATERFEPDPEVDELDLPSLLFLIKSRLARLCRLLANRGEAVAAFEVELLFERQGTEQSTARERIQPATATLDEVELIDLLRLRLEARTFTAPVVGFELVAEGAAATKQQLQLFQQKPRRDPAVTQRALARVRAELGDACVVRAVLREGHLPEARFTWEPFPQTRAAAIAEKRSDNCSDGDTDSGLHAPMRLVRRILTKPSLVTHQKPLPDGWFVHSFAAGPVCNLVGPYVVSGGWWRREVHREYYFAETRRGDVFWIYHDRRSRRWFIHGMVE